MPLRLRQALVMLAAILLAGVMTVLGIWQMSVYRSQGEAALKARASQPPVSLDGVLAQGTPLGDLYGVQVSLTGHYLDRPQVLVGTTAPYRVVAAFWDKGRVIPVVRGTVTTPVAPTPLPTGTITQTGVLMPSESSDGTPVASELPSGSLPVVQVERLVQTWPDGTVSGFVTLRAADSSAQHLGTSTVALPEAPGHAQNQGYAIQWWVFAACTVIGGVVVARSLARRARDDSDDDLDDDEVQD